MSSSLSAPKAASDLGNVAHDPVSLLKDLTHTSGHILPRRRQLEVYVEIPLPSARGCKRSRPDYFTHLSRADTPPCPGILAHRHAVSTTQRGDNDLATEQASGDYTQVKLDTDGPLDTEHNLRRVMGELRTQETRYSELQSQLATMEQRLRFFVAQERQKALAQLEEQFTCPLCFEIMGAPYLLSGAHCGHTFCAMCILKWYFARMHDCGSWHGASHSPIAVRLLKRKWFVQKM
jgi:hypothetical protein